MRNNDDIIQQLIEKNRRLRDRVDISLNIIALQQEEIQRLKDEIVILKGQKPCPKIPPSFLEGSQSKDRQNNSNKLSRGKHLCHQKNQKLEIHTRSRIKPESVPEGAIFKGC